MQRMRKFGTVDTLSIRICDYSVHVDVNIASYGRRRTKPSEDVKVVDMSTLNVHTLLVAVLGLALAISVIGLFRRGQLSFRFAIGWLGVASVGLLASLFIPVTDPVAELLDLSAPALLALIVSFFLIMITVQLSISISGLQKQIRALASEIARLEFEVRSRAQPDA